MRSANGISYRYSQKIMSQWNEEGKVINRHFLFLKHDIIFRCCTRYDIGLLTSKAGLTGFLKSSKIALSALARASLSFPAE